MKYKVALKKNDEGYSVSVPGLPACWLQGVTEQDAFASVEEGIREHLEVAGDLKGGSVLRETEIAV